MADWLSDMAQTIFTDRLAEFVALVIGGVIALLLRHIGRGLSDLFSYFSKLRRVRKAIARQMGPSGMREGPGVWLTQPISYPPNYSMDMSSAKVINIANLKGGVGKTTITANLGAAIAARGLRVLIIDLDFQGTLSGMARPSDWLPPKGQDSMSTKLISGALAPDITAQSLPSVEGWERFLDQQKVPASSDLRILTSFYDLANAENRIMISWLIGDETLDPRYCLSRILNTPAIRDRYDYVLIDSPPRLTTGAIQAICASSRVLIPTVLDRASASAVRTLLDQLSLLRDSNICPHLGDALVIGSMTGNAPAVEAVGRTYLADLLSEAHTPYEFLESSLDIKHRSLFGRGQIRGIPYIVFPPAEGQDIRDEFDRLASRVIERMG